MSEDYVCQECGFTQASTSDGETCPFCGGNFVDLNDELAVADDNFMEESDSEEDMGFGLEEFPRAA